MSKFEYTDEMVAEMHSQADSGVTEATIETLMEDFGFPRRSVTAKLRKLGFDVPKKPGAAPVFSADETDALSEVLSDNPGVHTADGQIETRVEDGKYLEEIAESLGRTVNSIRGKLLSMGLRAVQRDKKTSKSDPYEGIEDMLDMTVEEIADHFDKTVRGVKTVLTRRGLSCTDYTPKSVAE